MVGRLFLEKRLWNKKTKSYGGHMTDDKKRNQGVDLLRIIAMFFVCTLHVLDSILEYTNEFSANWYIAWILYLCSFCAVNCYALISGYVGVDSKYKFSNIVSLWLEVVFYSVIIDIIFILFKVENIKKLYFDFFPVIFNKYWYFTSYFGLFLFMPILNHALNNTPRLILKYSLFAIVGTSTVFSMIDANIFMLQKGFSALWLIILYLVGGYIKKYNPLKKYKKALLIASLIALIILTMLTKILLEYTRLGARIRATGFKGFIFYNSPTFFLISVVMLTLFSEIKFNKKSVLINFFAPLTFGVYIIHCNFILRPFVYKVLKQFIQYNPILFILAIVVATLVVYVGCSLIDYVRLLIFKVLRVKKNLLKLEERLKKSLNK